MALSQDTKCLYLHQSMYVGVNADIQGELFLPKI